MATIIDELVAKIGFDTTGLKESAKDVNGAFDDVGKRSEETAKKIKDQGKQSEEFFKTARSAALKFFAVFTAGAGVMGMFKNVTNLNVAIGNLSERTGQSAKSIKALGNIFKETGYSAEEAYSGFENFTKSVSDLQAGQGLSGVLEGLTKLGVGFMDANGRARDWGNVLLDAGSKAKELTGGDAARAAQLMQSWGFDAASAHIATSKAARERYQSERATVQITAEQIQKSRDLKKSQEELAQRFEAVQQILVERLTPALETLVGFLEKIATWGENNKTALTAIFIALGVAVAALAAPFVIIAAKIVAATIAAAAFAAPFIIVAAKIAAVTAAVVGLMIAFQKLVPNIPKWATEGWDWMKDKATSFKEWISGPATTSPETASSSNSQPPRTAGAALPSGKIGRWFYGLFDSKSEEKKTGSGIVAGGKYAGIDADPIWGGVAGLIGKGESGNLGYSAVNLGKKHGYKSGRKDLSKMTVDEVLGAQNRKEFNAAGRWQMLPSTLAAGKKALRLTGKEKFTPELQDRFLKEYLLTKKRPEVGAYLTGKHNNSDKAILGLAKEFASIPTASGRSYYQKDGVNRAYHSAEEVRRTLADTKKRYLAQTTPQRSAASNVSIGHITVNTQATDAKGIAKGLRGELRNQVAGAWATGAG